MAKISIRSLIRGVRKRRNWLGRRGADRIGAGLAAASGDAARDRRSWHEAAGHYARALSANPGWTAIRVQLANMLKEAGDLETAEAEYRRVLETESNNADTWLQLGHALKLQMRLADAREAYLTAAICDPDLQSARTELRMAGMSDAAVERHLASFMPPNLSSEGGDQSVLRRDLRSVDNGRYLLPSGVISDIGRNYVAGHLDDISSIEFPITLVCRESGTEVSTLVIEAENDDLLPGPISFRFDFVDPDALGVLDISIEPGGIRLVGSPFLLPSVRGSALLDRVARLEDRVVRPTISDDFIDQLEHRLTPRVARRAGAQLEQIIRYQREAFERQLLALEARLDPSFNPVPDLSQPKDLGPAVKILTASEMFPGLGWGSAELGPGGLLVRRIIDRGHLAVRLARGCGAVLRARIPASTSRSQVSRIRVGAAGAWLPSWVEFHDENGSSNAHWLLTALIAPAAIDLDGTVNCFVDCSGGFGNSGLADGPGIMEVGLYSVPISEATDISIASDGWWTLARDMNRRRMIVLPGLDKAAEVALELSGDFRRAAVELNGHSIGDIDVMKEVGSIPIASEVWNIGTPNLLVLTGLQRDSEGEVRVVDTNSFKCRTGM